MRGLRHDVADGESRLGPRRSKPEDALRRARAAPVLVKCCPAVPEGKDAPSGGIAGILQQKINHEEVLETGAMVRDTLVRYLKALLPRLG